MSPGGFSLVRTFYRNERAYLARTSRLSWLLDIDRSTVASLLKEPQDILDHCSRMFEHHSLLLPGLLNPNYGPVLYTIVRVLKPRVVVETGVGSGVSSAFLLAGMARNGSGNLYSVDLPLPDEGILPKDRQTGWVVPDEFRNRWELVLGDAKKELPVLLGRLGAIDIFYHDSDHSYRHMLWEFNEAFPYITPGGLLISDDTSWGGAWNQFTGSLPGRRININRTGIFWKKP